MAKCSECKIGAGHLLGCSQAAQPRPWRVATVLVVEEMDAERAGALVRERLPRVDGVVEVTVAGIAPAQRMLKPGDAEEALRLVELTALQDQCNRETAAALADHERRAGDAPPWALQSF